MGTPLKLAVSVLTAGAIGAAALHGIGQPVHALPSKPNIIFIILDDVGIDKLTIFGNGGVLPPLTPNIDLIAARGVKFTNAWAMPECSPSRAAFFTGRYPLRTGVEAAIVDNHLPQSYVSSFEATLPRVLTKAGYTSALIGKYHLGSEQDPAQLCAPSTRGFPVFQGAMTAGPPSVDMTAGGVDSGGSQVCGYFQTTAPGACYTTPGDAVRCTIIDASNADPGTDPARTCLQRGGIFVPNKACRVNEPAYSDFSRTNGYYVWPRTALTGVLDSLYVDVNHVCGSTINRTYLTQAQGNDGVNWWRQQSGPRMLTLSFNSMHTPVQKPPTDLVPDPLDAVSTCSNATPPRTLLNMMIEGADVQIGRTLSQLGLGTLGPDGRTLTSLNLDNTVVVIIGDNGSQGQAVRAPFNPVRAKTTVYQTGVWVPLIVAGSVVVSPGRSVDAMVNAVDLYKLFGDLAGVDIASVVPPSHALDSQPMLPFLITPSVTEIRNTNFTQEGVATYSPVPTKRSYPCQLGNACNDTLFGDKDFCEIDNGGTWYGPGGAKQLTSCCAVQSYLGTTLTLAPVHQYAVRNKMFKLVSLQTLDCSQPITNSSQAKPFPWAEYLTSTTQELYDLTPTSANPLGLDNAAFNLAQNCPPGQTDLTSCLPTPAARMNYQALNTELQSTMNSANAQNGCQAKGDGNLDLRITQADIQGWQAYNGRGPSRYDIHLDGQTDEKDLAIIQANLGQDCLNICVRADLNRDGKIDAADLGLLYTQTGVCTDPIFCSGDLDGDGNVNNNDVQIMTAAQATCNSNGPANRLSHTMESQPAIPVVVSPFGTMAITANPGTSELPKMNATQPAMPVIANPATVQTTPTNPAIPEPPKTNVTQQSLGAYTAVPPERSDSCRNGAGVFCDDRRNTSELSCLNSGGTWYGPGDCR
ncbi:MAG: sulfatase-like hydrolase/transferase [Rhizobiales bacterium]|nr:sulfatase-like hydrolase/transferase [Hyphomicrobiales bacterium]